MGIGGAIPKDDQTADQTADRLHSAAIHLLRRLRREDEASGLTAPRLSALSVVVFNGPLTLSALADAEQVRAPTITRIIAALEGAGLVSREPDPADGRAALVRATPAGVRLLGKARSRRLAALSSEMKELPPDDLATLERAAVILERLVRVPDHR
jgi:DNA-binding MarR family transcriptional regulator